MKKVIVWLVAIVVMIGVVIGCIHWYNSSVNNVIENPNNDLNSGDIEINSGEENKKEEALFTLENYPKVDASLAIHPLVDSIASDFLGVDESELDFEYTKTRTSEVYRNLIDGKVDVIFAAEISKEDEEYARQKGVELKIIPATSSAFVFIVNTENPVENLTFEQIQKIYTGEITNWAEVGGESGDIIAYQRPTGSGSQTAMLSLVMKDKQIMTPPLTQIEQEMGGLIDAIAEYDNSKYALGYSYFYYVNTMYKKDTIKMVSVDGVMPTIETIKNGTYPIYTNAFIVTRANEENENVDKWVEAMLSERGSKIIEDAGYVPVENIEDNNIESTSKLETAYNTIINAQGENAEALILFPETSDDYIEGLYSGLKDIKTKEKILYVHPIGMACEIALVEVENEDDIEKVEKIFKDRIEKGINAAMCDSASQDIWRRRAEIQIKDNCICMIVLPDENVIPEDIFK